ncbi:C-type lectin domain family 2 member F-like [Acomys russatus]|uniref:C-type lectin domain family 2 member F-like n=1 Tax=Acomys russatus TaxID=60746 RepID=UPI0021E230B0|nr:C-type lectin domain family 2 member F-like [Acomys russatus]
MGSCPWSHPPALRKAAKDPTPHGNTGNWVHLAWRERHEACGAKPCPHGKKLMSLWFLIIGVVAVLLWGLFSFPRKSEVTRLIRNKTCGEEAKICMNSWKKLNQNCFFLFHHKSSWLSALENCQNYDGTLAKFNNKIELDTLMNHVKVGSSSYWIGLNKRNLLRMWVWTDGSKYNNLMRIQDHGQCALMYKDGIASIHCEDLNDYICIKASQCP